MRDWKDVESSPSIPGSSGSPTIRMLGRGVAEARRKIVYLVLALVLVTVVFAGLRKQEQVTRLIEYGRPNVHSGATSEQGHKILSKQSLIDIRNDTLGFGNIYVVNMKERSDKLDAMRLTASLTGFNFETLPGVDGSKVAPKALSKTFPNNNSHPGVIGCWRSHINFARKVIEDNLASAMVMEDDADWDVAFPSQLENFALGSQSLLDTPQDSTPTSPYGDGWDLLWLGHCASIPLKSDTRRFLIKNDPTVTPPTKRANWGATPDMSGYDNNTRIVYRVEDASCTYAYGLSQHGAQKMLKWMSMDIYGTPIDYGLHEMCSKPERNFTCISVFPQLIAEHKAAGSTVKDSDIGITDPQTRKKGFSFNIVHSTRVNVDALIDGRADDVVSQWPDLEPGLTGPIVTEFRKE